jgi:hypothetical protein
MWRRIGVRILSIAQSKISISILSVENNYMWRQYITYKDSLYRWLTPGDQYKESLYVMYCLHIWLFSTLKIEILILLWAILKILTPILRHVQSSIVCYCLFNVWIAVFRLFLLYVEAWLMQIPIFEVKNHIWALILLKAEIAVIGQFLFKVLVSHINFHIKSLYIMWFPPCDAPLHLLTQGA